jgi:hypothetical protein
MFHRMAVVRTEVLEEFIASIIRGTGIGELRTMLAVTSNRHTLKGNIISLQRASNVFSSPIPVTLMMEVRLSFEMSVLTTAIWRHIPEDGNF